MQTYTNISSFVDTYKSYIRTTIDTRRYSGPETHQHRYRNTQTYLQMQVTDIHIVSPIHRHSQINVVRHMVISPACKGRQSCTDT